MFPLRIVRTLALAAFISLLGVILGAKIPPAYGAQLEASETPSANPVETEAEETPTLQEVLPSATMTATPPAEASTPQASETPTGTSNILETPTDAQFKEPQRKPPPGDYAKGEVVIKMGRSASRENIAKCLGGMGFHAKPLSEEAHLWKIKIEPEYMGDALARLQNCAGVKYAEPNYVVEAADTIPSDAYYWGNQSPALAAIRAPQGWDLSTGSPAVTIAIVDTGVDLSHPDLSGKIVNGWDFYNNDAIAQDDSVDSHGTRVAGIAAAASNNGIGVAGVSWGAKIMPVKVLDPAKLGWSADLALGIRWAADNGAQVINLSLGTWSWSLAVQDAVNHAYSKGCILIAATGNDAASSIRYPALYPHVIAVGAVNPVTETRAGFSNYGSQTDLTAPGVSIYSTTIGSYGYQDGTSMATAYVSGLAAILRGYPGGYSPDAIEWAMESTAKDLGLAGWDGEYGYGLIQMDAAIRLVLPPTPTPLGRSGAEQGQPFGGWGLAPPISTWTPTPTFTPALASSTPTATTTAETPRAETPSPTSLPQAKDVSAQSMPRGEDKEEASSAPFGMPLLGALSILLGIWLFIVAGKRNRRNGKIKF